MIAAEASHAIVFDGQRVSAHVDRMPIREVLRELSSQLHVVARVSPNVHGEINGVFEHQSVQKALKILLRDYNVALQWSGKKDPKLVGLDILASGSGGGKLERMIPAKQMQRHFSSHASQKSSSFVPVARRAQMDKKQQQLHARQVRRVPKNTAGQGAQVSPRQASMMARQARHQHELVAMRVSRRHQTKGAKHAMVKIDPDLLAHRRAPKNAMEAQQLHRAMAARHMHAGLF